MSYANSFNGKGNGKKNSSFITQIVVLIIVFFIGVGFGAFLTFGSLQERYENYILDGALRYNNYRSNYGLEDLNNEERRLQHNLTFYEIVSQYDNAELNEKMSELGDCIARYEVDFNSVVLEECNALNFELEKALYESMKERYKEVVE